LKPETRFEIMKKVKRITTH